MNVNDLVIKLNKDFADISFRTVIRDTQIKELQINKGNIINGKIISEIPLENWDEEEVVCYMIDDDSLIIWVTTNMYKNFTVDRNEIIDYLKEEGYLLWY